MNVWSLLALLIIAILFAALLFAIIWAAERPKREIDRIFDKAEERIDRIFDRYAEGGPRLGPPQVASKSPGSESGADLAAGAAPSPSEVGEGERVT